MNNYYDMGKYYDSGQTSARSSQSGCRLLDARVSRTQNGTNVRIYNPFVRNVKAESC